MVAWILVELAFIRELSFFHPLYVAVGLLMVWAGFRAVRVDLGVPAASLAQELRDVLADVPRFLAAPLIRRRHLRWGATDDEVAATLLGDDRQPEPDYVSTRALTIAAPPERVWPWLVQVGRGRAGFYSDDLLDNGAVPSAQDDRRRAAAAATSGSGSRWPRRITPRTAFRVAEVWAPHELLWRKPDSTWAWTADADGHGRHPPGHPDPRHPRPSAPGVVAVQPAPAGGRGLRRCSVGCCCTCANEPSGRSTSVPRREVRHEAPRARGRRRRLVDAAPPGPHLRLHAARAGAPAAR